MALEFAGSEPSRKAPVFSVSQLNRLVADLLEASCPPLWVSGEISNFTRAASGHWYFTLKDASAQVRCVMFRGRAQSVGFVPREGDKVEARGLPGLYQARGDFQLGVEQMRRAGAGDLYQQFLRIKERLLAEGLLDSARKRALPALPRRVGVITSPQAAALRDVLATLRARAPQVEVVLYPTPVQGAEAPGALVAALGAASRRAECDVVLLVRGGGSIEDLWAFNDEAVARAIAACSMPVICGIGHETDFTIADFVADLRAPTPTAAATAAVPARAELLARLAALAVRLSQRRERAQQALEQRLDLAARQLRSPAAYWQERASGLRALAVRLQRAGAVRIARADDRLHFAAARLREPPVGVAHQQLQRLALRLARGGAAVLAGQAGRLDAGAHKLELVSPQAVLARGYSILQRADGAVVRSASQVSVGEPLHAALADGGLAVQVTGTRSE
ncbi:MAG: exodeoxyribonuclease VII large subunit [Burkholderiaceae bacterium]|jgi:exodeoxyribonuclease VII large subunit|nr:exodeoxyribonuclease VII large subunit [Burkholderiaceae bacterium]